MTQRQIDGDYIYFVTANVKDRRWYFIDPKQAAKLGEAIKTCCEMKRFVLLTFCILPNHVHLLVRKRTADEKGSQRKLESMRWDGVESSPHYLFPHRRLSSRRCDTEKGPTLSKLMQSIKGSYSRTLPMGTFWQHRSYFRIIETEEYLYNVIHHLQFNYQKMGLPGMYGQPPYVCINYRALNKLF